MAPRLVVCAVAIGLTCACSQGPASTTSAPASSSASAGQTRTYFIAADDVVWDFAPSGKNQATGQPFSEEASFFAMPGPMSLGHVYKKSLFREYTDATFKTLKPRPAAWEHLGMLGPVVRAEVGDTIKIVFKNNGQHRYSLHPHGVFYTKDSEGAEYDDGTGKKLGVEPGATHTYEWPVPERAGPAHGEGSSIIWMYHSHIEEEKDVNSGLIGPMIVTAKGQANPDGSPKDVDREIVAGFLEVDENLSWHIDDNIKAYARQGLAHQEDRQLRRSALRRESQGDDQRLRLRQHAGLHDAEGPEGSLVSDGVDELRDPFPALARQHRRRAPHADRRRAAAADGHGRRRHGAGQRRHLAVPLPHGPASAGRDDFEVHGERRGDEDEIGSRGFRFTELLNLEEPLGTTGNPREPPA